MSLRNLPIWCLLLAMAASLGGSGLALHRLTAHAGEQHAHHRTGHVQGHGERLEHDHGGCNGHTDDQPAAPDEPVPDHDDDCPVCVTILSGKTALPVLPSVQIAFLADLSTQAAHVEVRRASRWSLRSALPRGPPAA